MGFTGSADYELSKNLAVITSVKAPLGFVKPNGNFRIAVLKFIVVFRIPQFDLDVQRFGDADHCQ